MAKNTKQIALIQHRRGKLSELPKELNDGEIGFATDTNEIFIGNASHPSLAKRIEENIFPYGNVQILTEFTDNLNKIKYRYKSNTDITARLPIVAIGTVSSPVIAQNTSLFINTIEVKFKEASTLASIVAKINKTPLLKVKAFIHNNTYLGLITTETELSLEDGVTYGKGIIERLGFGADSTYSQTFSLPPQRTLQSVLDDYCSVKDYGAFGNGLTDDSEMIYNAIISLNKAGNDPQYYRTLFFPSGTYLVKSNVIPLPYGTHLKGEGIGRTVIKSVDYLNAILTTMDDNMNIGTSVQYGMDTNVAETITVEDMTFDVSDSMTSSLLHLATCKNVLFRNVEFKGKDVTTLVRISDSTYSNKCSNIMFENCVFNDGESAITSYSDIEHLIIKNCIFRNIKNEAIKLEPFDGKQIINCILDGNIFDNCSSKAKSVILLGKNTQYISVINSKFDKDITDYISNVKPYITESELNYTDILDATLSDKKILQFKFTQPIWAYIDYLMNPNGEYLVQSHYNKTLINGEKQISPLTNGIVIEQGDETNENTVSIVASNQLEDLNVNSGSYGDLHLGSNLDYNTNEEWISFTQYRVSDRVQITDDDKTVKIYECIKEHVSSSDTKPESSADYWKYLGTFNPTLQIHKNTNLNGNSIRSDNGNIIFKTTNDNVLLIDNASNEKAYAKRLGGQYDAIPNVEYVNSVGRSSIRKVFDFKELGGEGNARLNTIVKFDRETYGDFVNIKNITVNVRTPFYPISKYLNENTLSWKAGLYYNIGDVVKVLEENQTSTAFNMYILTNGEWIEYNYDDILKPTSNQMDGTGLPLNTFGTNGKYAVYITNGTKHIYYKQSGHWVEVGSSDWAKLYSSFAQGTKSSYTANAIVKINNREITLTGTTVAKAVEEINASFTDGSVVASNVNGNLRITQTQGILTYDDVKYSAFMDMGFPLDMATGDYKTTTAELLNVFDGSTPTSDIDGSVWIKADSKYYYYVCLKEHTSNNTFEEELTGEYKYFTEVYNQGLNQATSNIEDLNDLKFFSIHGDNAEDASVYLFKHNEIDVSRRDIHSKYYKEFAINTAYNKGDVVQYHNRYYTCLITYTSSSEYDLYDNLKWIIVEENGFNYHYDFERTLYKLTDGNLTPLYNTSYNYAGYTMYLDTNDENGNSLLNFRKVDDPTDTDYYKQINPSGYVIVTIDYIRGEKDEN